MDWTTVKSLIIPQGEVRKIVNSSGSVIWEKPGEEYTFIECLEIPSGTRLDTGIACESTDYYYVDFAPVSVPAYGSIIDAGARKILRVYVDGTNIQMKMDWYNQNTATAVAGTRLNMAFENQITYLNGVQKTNMSGVPNFTPNTNVMIGGLNAKWQLYGCRHGKTSDNLDFDYVPAIRNSDSVAGLHDNITGAFLPYGSAAQ